MQANMNGEELAALIERVFRPRPEDRALAILVDLPDRRTKDSAPWRERRRMAAEWAAALAPMKERIGFEVHFYAYRNAGMNNADLPLGAWPQDPVHLADSADDLDPGGLLPFADIFRSHGILMAVTQFSATAPLKLAAREFGFRAATMPGFSQAMIPSLRLDYLEIDRRVLLLKNLLDEAVAAELVFATPDGREHGLRLDLRHRAAHASSGLLHQPGTAGNLPSGETYIVPYEGERQNDPSASDGMLPVEFSGEVVVYRIEGNRAVEVMGENRAAAREADHLSREPAYGNIAELGLGVLADFGVEPCGSLLLDEKLGLHIAFGRSDHFGGQVGAAQFSKPEEVVHIDRVYLRSMQPLVEVRRVDLRMPDGTGYPLIRNDRFVVNY